MSVIVIPDSCSGTDLPSCTERFELRAAQYRSNEVLSIRNTESENLLPSELRD